MAAAVMPGTDTAIFYGGITSTRYTNSNIYVLNLANKTWMTSVDKAPTPPISAPTQTTPTSTDTPTAVPGDESDRDRGRDFVFAVAALEGICICILLIAIYWIYRRLGWINNNDDERKLPVVTNQDIGNWTDNNAGKGKVPGNTEQVIKDRDEPENPPASQIEIPEASNSAWQDGATDIGLSSIGTPIKLQIEQNSNLRRDSLARWKLRTGIRAKQNVMKDDDGMDNIDNFWNEGGSLFKSYNPSQNQMSAAEIKPSGALSLARTVQDPDAVSSRTHTQASAFLATVPSVATMTTATSDSCPHPQFDCQDMAAR
ncbi:hypothetical protein BGX26_010725 [Mortierella sp. AD094]|nr:hypothetical protein BGX26_010725 [Mortierella sp. AD094]